MNNIFTLIGKVLPFTIYTNLPGLRMLYTPKLSGEIVRELFRHYHSVI